MKRTDTVEFSEALFQIIEILSDGEFHSGSTIASQLHLSRAAVCKKIARLEKLGLEYSSIPGKGYRLNRPLDLLNQTKIADGLTQKTAAWVGDLELLPVVASTNSYLLAEPDRIVPNAARICLAEFQSAGRGRLGRQWISPFGHNVYLSIGWQYPCGPGAISALSLAVGVAVIRALNGMGIQGVGLKWPNDIYWGGHKLGGILIDVIGESTGPCVVVIGVGLNLFLSTTQARQIDQPWTDLSQVTFTDGIETIDRNQLVAGLINEILLCVIGYENIGLSPYLTEWRQADCLYGHQATVYNAGQQEIVQVAGITDEGFLMVTLADGRPKTFASGEVSFHQPSI
jgi:BirA family biotin operon repressor/biotin-[acetyl-CoA-carboxylase] ligase